MVATKTKVTLCKSKVKNEDGTIRACENPMPSGLCSERTEHLSPLRTGFCAVEAHEGVAKKSHSGAYMRTCEKWKTCPCDCHKTFDQMFAMSGMPRVVVDNSRYVSPHNPFWMPTPEERAAMRAAAEAKATVEEVVIASPDPENIPISFRKEYAPTPTGRAARGQLESEVRAACDVWMQGKTADLCTPAWLSAQVATARGGGDAPSVGAIDAIFKRWEGIGFAVIERKPTRFVKYTPEGVAKGIEALKIAAKTRGKLEAGQAARTLRAKK